MVVPIVLAAFMVWLLVMVVWPPTGAPAWWRDVTRPVRRRLRPGHYRYRGFR